MKQWEDWVVFAGAIVLSLFTQATSNIVINVSVVVLVLLVLAYYSEKSDRAILNILATVVFLFVLYRFSREAIPSVRQLADGVGSLFGMVSVLWGKGTLPIGATFAGIDLLVLMLFFWAFWAVHQPSLRGKKIFVALGAIFVAQLIYLVVLSFSMQLLDLLPAPFYATEDESNRTGVWAWQNAVRAMIPWNLPALAAVLQLFVLGGMARMWNSATESAVEEKNIRPNAREPLPVKADARQPIEVWLPAVLCLLFVLSATVSLQPTTLKDKNILANLDSFVSWRKPDFGQANLNGFGELSLFIESLGGRLSFSRQFTDDELSRADLVILLHPSQAWTDEEKNRIQNYVSRGGKLLVAADTFRKEGEKRSTTNDIAAFSGIQVEQAIAAFLVDDGEQSLETIAHPAVVGLNDSHGGFGFQRGSPLHVSWPAGPILINPWGWSEPALNVSDEYQPNLTLETRLGDLVVAAERSYGSGKVVVLGDVNALSNDRLPVSYEFVGRLLASLAQGTGSTVGFLYQGCMLLLSGILIGLIAYRPEERKTLASVVVFAVALVVCNTMVAASASPMPKKPQTGNAFDIAYIDTSHLGRYCERLWDPYRGRSEEEGQAPTGYDFGFAGFTRALMRQGFLPFRMTKFDQQRLADAALTVSMAPAKSYSEKEIEEIKKYVEAGGVFVCMVGAEEARAVEPLLNTFSFSVAPMPVYPGERESEPWPHGAILMTYDEEAPSEDAMFYAAWSIRSLEDNSLLNLLNDKDGKLLIAGRALGKGRFVVIADTFFASNQNMEVLHPDNARYWTYLLQQITDRKPSSDKEDALKERGLE